MANTTFFTKIAISDADLERLRLSRRQVYMLFDDAKLRPPVLEEMMTDIQRVVASVAKQYSDPSSSHLNYTDMVGEGNLKLAEIVDKGMVEALPTRAEFFKYFKTAVVNNARSRVQKFCFTEKRTGQKAPPRELRFDSTGAPAEHEGYHKNVEVSLDDPDSGVHVSDKSDHCETDELDIDWGFNHTTADFAFYLTPVEKLVLHELCAPSAHARVYAELDALRKAKPGKLHLKIKHTNMAAAIGIAHELFEEAVLSIQTKKTIYNMSTEAQQDKLARENAIIAQLKQVFGLHIPPDIDSMVIRRLLTMAARAQFDKLNPQLNEMLTEVGAKVPVTSGDNKLSCYGVLYQRTCRPCNICDLRHSCQVEAANLGLTSMVMSPRLLGAKQPRQPAFLPNMNADVSSQISSADEAEVINHLDETFDKTTRSGKTYYYHRIGPKSERRLLFCIERSAPLKLRFCDPSDSLKKRLDGKQKTWCAKTDAALAEVFDMIEQHSKETFA